MTASGTARSRFRRALRTGDPAVCMALAAEVERLSVPESFALCLVLARARDDRFDRAAQRLVSRVVAELGAPLADAATLTAALALIGEGAAAERSVHRAATLLEQLGARGALRETS
jgi:hypothetical protein